MTAQKEIIRLAENFVKQELGSDTSGHDWWHIERVRKLAIEIAKTENADGFVCELAALLHDVADEKLNATKEDGILKVQDWLMMHELDMNVVLHVMTIISTMSYNGGQNPQMETIEGQIVQDADRLDALGAVGIARTFAYCGWKGQMIHHPDLSFDNKHYRSADKSAVYHFYEKLLKLKDLMNTEYARNLAASRHTFMETYLEQFYREWDLHDKLK